MLRNFGAILLTLAIPLVLFMSIWQTSRYSKLENELSKMEQQQYEIINSNRILISGITVLSTPDRIEKIAVEDLKMRKALPDEILRIELKKGELGG